MKNLAVLALLQVFFSRDTGLMFIPAEKENVYIYFFNYEHKMGINAQGL